MYLVSVDENQAIYLQRFILITNRLKVSNISSSVYCLCLYFVIDLVIKGP